MNKEEHHKMMLQLEEILKTPSLDVGGLADRLKNINKLKSTIEELISQAPNYIRLSEVEIAICDAAFSRVSLALSIWEAVLSRRYEPGDAEMDTQEVEESDGLRDALIAYWDGCQPDYSADDFYAGGA